jgi:hypothetical protein
MAPKLHTVTVRRSIISTDRSVDRDVNREIAKAEKKGWRFTSQEARGRWEIALHFERD